MSMLKEAFEAGKFGVTAEMAPPKGYDFSEQLEAAKLLNGKVHGVNVTDMQSASLKASSLGLCVALKNAGIEPILQMTGRDRNRMAIMGDILSAAAFGIDTMLALTGDHPVVGDCPESKPVYDLDSVGILKMLTKMEQTNCDCGGNEIAGARRSSTRALPSLRSMTPSSCRSTSCARRSKTARSTSRRRVFLIWKRSSASWIRSTRPVSRRISWLVSSRSRLRAWRGT